MNGLLLSWIYVLAITLKVIIFLNCQLKNCAEIIFFILKLFLSYKTFLQKIKTTSPTWSIPFQRCFECLLILLGIDFPIFDFMWESFIVRDKLKITFLKTKRFKEQRNSVHQKIKNKKANFVRNQLQKSTKKSKELWKVSKNIGLSSEAAPVSEICLKENDFT